ncbi:hypothetical protein LF887_15410 [Chryseobacterium sp. MEBOG06]|uniref:hypothetical protein n=1 Tax=Chryseobacterium sp. MEBOG06 TaxID=2879938 RepID=UPI001F365108|nr:hypothetical protein [Chryseobacterium sp. MEBOG06]UKB82392.1 hypothetical protein LF887_15410 [Chryseobacterium sp. MEBOG06]
MPAENVAKSIENALGRAIPVLIGFLASLLGIGGLADKVLGVIRKIRQRIENAIVKFWNFVKGKAKGLLGKIGVSGKKDKKEKKGEDLRSTEEKKRDLDEGVKEGTQLLNDHNLTAKEGENRLKTIKQTYELKELKIVTDKVEKDKAIVHIHGEVNPYLDGNRTVVDFKKNSPELTNAEIAIVVKLPGGQEVIDKMNRASSDDKFNYIAEARTALDALESGQENIVLEKKLFNSKKQLITAIDLVSNDEMIEVKSGVLLNDEKLSGRAFTQFSRYIGFFKGSMKFFDEKGDRVMPPSKFIYQFSEPKVNDKLVKWLLEKGVTEIRYGKN